MKNNLLARERASLASCPGGGFAKPPPYGETQTLYKRNQLISPEFTLSGGVRESKLSARLVELFPSLGEVAERFKAHAWKACVG